VSKRRDRKVQYAALPFRPKDGGIEIMLVTSRETRRWVIPKGWPMKGRSPAEAAAQEALEEAGVEGPISDKPVGHYRYNKRLADGSLRNTRVHVFALKVKAEKDDWAERAERERRWFDPLDAVAAVDEHDLRALIAAFARLALDAVDRGANPEP